MYFRIRCLMNNHCTSNTRRNVFSAFMIHISATRRILKDEQIIFTAVMGSQCTPHAIAMVSKQFLCECERCSDQTERGSNISAIKCKNKTCLVLPINSLDFRSTAKCNECHSLVEYKQFFQIQIITPNMVKNKLNFNNKFNLFELVEFIERSLKNILPECSQFIIEGKLEAICKCDLRSREGRFLSFAICYLEL